MKTLIAPARVLAVLVGLSVLPASAGETFRTTRGKEFRDCTIVGKDPHGLTFRHSGGIAKLAYADMPSKMQERFKYDKVEAKRFVDKRRPKPAPVVGMRGSRGEPAVISDRVREGALAARPRGRYIRNPYALVGSVHQPAAYGAAFGGFVQPYYAGSFGTPALVTSIPNGFFAPNTLRVGARPMLESPVAAGMGSYSQYRDARASAVRAAVRSYHRPSAPTHGRSAGRGGRR